MKRAEAIDRAYRLGWNRSELDNATELAPAKLWDLAGIPRDTPVSSTELFVAYNRGAADEVTTRVDG